MSPVSSLTGGRRTRITDVGLDLARDPRPVSPLPEAERRTAENVWPDRARLGRDWHRSAG